MRTTRIQCYKKMKKKQTIWRVLAMMLVVAVCAGFAACGGGDDDDDPVPESILYTSVNNLTFQSVKGDKQTVTITCNGSWSLSVPDWLESSASSGYESSTITLTTKEDNKSTNDNTGTVTITSGTKLVSIAVTQTAGVMKGLEVKPKDIVILSDAVAFTCDYGSSVSYYYRMVLPASAIELVSDDEILAYMQSEGERLAKSEDYVLLNSGLTENTKHAILTVGFDRNGNHGEVIRTDFTTKAIKNIEPKAYVTNLNYTSTRWTWDTQKNAVCNTYYMLSTEDYDIAASADVYQAWLIQSLIKSGDTQQLLNDGSWYRTRSGYFVYVWTWGLDSSGTFAGEIYYDYIMDSSAKKNVIEKKKASSLTYDMKPIPSRDKFKVYKMTN